MYELLKLGISGQFRKPNPGMLKLAAYLHSADECLMIGDRPEDEQAAAAAGIKFLSADVWAGGSDNANG
jgi:D-glycero-D-manno-heptose 1,7-bisphosphate phosphatase